MEMKDMTLKDVESRLSEIDSIRETSEDASEIETLAAEVEELQARKVELADLEQRKADAKALEENRADETVEVVEERKEEITMKTVEEYRNSKEYIDAYAEYIKSGKDEEVRSLLTTNVGEGGTIAVPDFVYDEVKTAWDNNEITSLVKKVSIQGNLKVQFEVSGTAAVVHTEGGDPVDEEELVLGIVTLIPESIKKWISISDEALDLRGQAFLNYIYAELTQKIAQKCADILVGKIAALGTSATATAPAAAQVTAAPALDTIATALGYLSDQASNPVIIMNRLTWSAFKAVQYAGNYAIDPFEGLKVVFNNSLPAFSAAEDEDVYAIVGDLGYGAIANFPNGEGVQIKVDDKTAMTSDLVKILGREFVGIGPVACGAFVNIVKPETT